MIWVLVLLIMGGGYFAASETGFASCNAMYITKLADGGDRRAKRAEYILEHFNKALSALLIGNNIMHICTATLSTYLVTKTWGEGYTAHTTIVTTVVVFLVAEMIPKQYAKDKPEKAALFFAPSLYWIMKLLTPVCIVFDSISAFVIKVLKAPKTPTVTEDELDYIIESLSETQTDGKRRSRLLHSALHFDDKSAADVMTPITSVVCIDVTANLEEVKEVVRKNKFSRIPVCRGRADNVVGILDVRKFIRTQLAGDGNFSLRRMMSKPKSVLATKRIDELLDEMAGSRTHFCIVKNEAGEAIGIITVEDIVEELVGEIMDEDDTSLPVREVQ